MIDESDYFTLATHLRCLTCGAGMKVTDLGFDITCMDDLDIAYEEGLCCEDPSYVAVIQSATPLFPENDPESEVNTNYHIRPNPRMQVFEDQWNYELNDDFFDLVEEQEDE